MGPGRVGKRILVGLVGLLACCTLAATWGAAPGAGAAGGRRPGSLDPSFGVGGRAVAKSTGETAPSEFTSAAMAPNGDLVIELKRRTPRVERHREIEVRRPSGALDPAFGKGGKLTVGGGSGLVVLADGDILIGVDKCDGTVGSVMMLNPHGGRVAGFGKDGCGAYAGFGEEFLTVDGQGRILLAGRREYCVPGCSKDVIPSSESVVARLLPDGSRDTGFGREGVVATRLDDHLEAAGFDAGVAPFALVAAPDGGVLIGTGEGVIRLAEDGSLDTAFGEGGVASGPESGSDLAVQPDGSIDLATSDYLGKAMLVTRFTPRGAVDTGFGGGGTARLPFPSQCDSDLIAAAPGGGVVVATAILPDTHARYYEETPVLVHLTATGQPDPSYGEAGIARLELPEPRLPSPTVARALVVDPDGSALVAGNDEDEDAFAAAFTPDGAARSSFGTAGKLIEHHEQPAQLEPTGLFQTPGGGFTVATQRATAPGLRTGFLVRFGADGRQRRFPDGAAATETLAHGIVLPDGAGRAVAWGGDGERNRVLLAAGPVGHLLDKRYGKNGSARFPKGLYPEAIAPAPGGGVAVIGALGKAMAVYRVSPKGHPDRRFGKDGLATVRFPGAGAIGFDGLVEADGDVVLAGSVGQRAGAARLLPDGRLDRSFGRGGRVSGLLGKGAFGLLVAPWHGGVVIAADQETTPRSSAGLVRLDSSGRLDPSFGRDGVVGGGAERPPLALFTGAGHIVVVTDPLFERGHRGGGVELRAWDADGRVDRAFGDDGVRFYGSGKGRHGFDPVAAIQQPDGKVVVAGTTVGTDRRRASVERHTETVLVRFLLR
jgi:uncharacterized delta-60 repeat protein